MTLRMIALAAALGLAAAVHAAPPAAQATTPPAAQATTPPAAKGMNYDCTKAGNKNKAICKNVVVPPAAAQAKPITAAPAAAKAVAPMAAARPRPVAAAKAANPNEVAATQKNGKVVHYNCSKAGNKDKKACAGK